MFNTNQLHNIFRGLVLLSLFAAAWVIYGMKEEIKVLKADRVEGRKEYLKRIGTAEKQIEQLKQDLTATLRQNELIKVDFNGKPIGK